MISRLSLKRNYSGEEEDDCTSYKVMKHYESQLDILTYFYTQLMIQKINDNSELTFHREYADRHWTEFEEQEDFKKIQQLWLDGKQLIQTLLEVREELDLVKNPPDLYAEDQLETYSEVKQESQLWSPIDFTNPELTPVPSEPCSPRILDHISNKAIKKNFVINSEWACCKVPDCDWILHDGINHNWITQMRKHFAAHFKDE